MDNSNSSAGGFDNTTGDHLGESTGSMDDALRNIGRTAGDTADQTANETARSVEDALRKVTGSAPWNQGEAAGNSGTTGPVTTDAADIENPGTTTLDEEFAGTGGVGSPDYMERLRKAHEERGDNFASSYGPPEEDKA